MIQLLFVLTAKQFVIEKYPNAELDYVVNTSYDHGLPHEYTLSHRGGTYRILSDSILNDYAVLAKGNTSQEAWRNAKKAIKNDITISPSR